MSKICKYIHYLWRILKLPIQKLRYKEYHLHSFVPESRMITPKYITCGNYIFVGRNARIEGVCKYNNVIYNPEIILSDGVSIEQNVHITCAEKVFIGSNTAISANVTITDINHPYTDIALPIEKQDIEVKKVIIREDCKIYNNAVILPGITIGKHCVIGANAVVTKDIPDYSVAVGAPARVIKRYNFETEAWEPVKE